VKIRTYKIQLIDNEKDNQVDFGPRKLGQIGKDILVVKKALGAIVDYSTLIHEGDNNPSLESPSGWFDCTSAEKISDLEAATFDRNMQRYLIKYQQDNQFYIISYLFSKISLQTPIDPQYGLAQKLNRTTDPYLLEGGGFFSPTISNVEGGYAADYTNNSFVSTQTEILQGLWAKEFGMLGEATLAVLHGWKPRTKAGNSTYYHDRRATAEQDGAYDLVLLGVYDSFLSGNFIQKPEDSEEILEPKRSLLAYIPTGRAIPGDQYYKNYQNQVSNIEDILSPNKQEVPGYETKPTLFVGVKYQLVSKESESLLYSALRAIPKQEGRPADVAMLSEQDFSSFSRRSVEPDPFIDPDPFVVDTKRIGYFMPTDYTISPVNLPPKQTDDNYISAIREIEDRALTDILRFYNKPDLWFLDSNDQRYNQTYKTDLVSRSPSHDQTYGESSVFVLTTKTIAENNNLDLTVYGEDYGPLDPLGSAEIYNRIEYMENTSNQLIDQQSDPIIKFVEFVTPSLRPGDVYRARFTINREKLRLISPGVEFEESVEPAGTPAESALNSSHETSNLDSELGTDCENGPLSDSELENRYNEYMALASRNRREIVRSFREAAIENYSNEQKASEATVELGVIGNTQLRFNTGQQGFLATLAEGAARFGTSGGHNIPFSANDATGIENPSLSSMQVNKDFKFFKEDVLAAARNLKEASENCDTSKIRFKPAFAGQAEVDHLKTAVEDLKKVIVAQIPNYNFGESKGADYANGLFGDTSATEASTSITGVFGGADSIQINFEAHKNGTGLTINKIIAAGKLIKSQKAKSILENSVALKRPRTLAYLAQSEAMRGSDQRFLESFQDTLGKPLGSAASHATDWALDGLSVCASGLGFGKKGLAFIIKYTPKIKAIEPEKHNPIYRYYEATVNGATDTAKGWWKGQTENFTSQFLEADFGTDEALDLFGPECTSYRELLMDFVYHFSPGKLLCDYLKCTKIPAVRFDIPKFSLPGTPDFSIFGWYKGLIGFLMDQWEQILNRILCSFVKMLLQFLKVPICGEHLRDELFGQAAAASPLMQKAFTNALTDLFLSEESIEKAPEFIDDMGKILTGEELCRILQGGPIDDPTMNLLLKLAKKAGIREINAEETLRSFFETISFYIPESMCQQLSQVTRVIGSSSCEDTSSYLDQIRRQMLANNATDEEIEHALDMANKNMMSEATAIEALMRGGLSAAMPDIVNFSNPDSIMNGLPPVLMKQMSNSAKDIFDTAKKGYISSLTAYSPALFLKSSRLPIPSDREYNEEASIIVETIAENLKLFSMLADRDNNVRNLTEQLHVLYQVYETAEYRDTGIKVMQAYSGFAFVPNGSIPQDYPNNGEKIEYDNRGSYGNIFALALKPIGVSQDSYRFNTNNIQDYSRRNRNIEIDGDNSPLKDFRFVYRYKIAKQSDIPNARENILLELISDRLGELQGELQTHLESISTTINYDGYLDIIRQVMTLSYENEIERTRSSRQLIEEASTGRETQTLKLSANLGPISSNVEMLEFKSPEESNTSAFDPYTIRIQDSPLFRGPKTFEYCDTIPGPGLDESSITPEQEEERQIYEEAISDISPGSYTRRELFTRKFWNSIKDSANSIYDTRQDLENLEDGEREDLLGINNWNSDPESFIKRYFYREGTLQFSEGIFEQIFFSLENSRMFDEENYYPELKRRVNGELYFSQEEGCYKNKYNVSQFGILSFEKMVTDELNDQIRKEMSKPENNPENLDIDDLGPIEKAIQNVALVGFVRVCLVELLLKGSIAYSVWDIESIADEPFFQDFVYEFIFQELESSQILDGKWKDIAERVTGIQQSKSALRNLVMTQVYQVQDSCKRIFDNQRGVDYYNWFIMNFVPQTNVSRIVSPGNLNEIRYRVDPVSNEVVDIEGNRVRDRDIVLDQVPQDFYWQHPLYSERANNEFLEGKKNFFHIEHLLEVRGPLARMESIILPSREIILNFIDADIANSPDEHLTRVERRNRNIERLNLRDSFSRFTNLRFPDLNDYDLFQADLPGSSSGTTAESTDDVSALFEVYHVRDFIDGIRSITGGGDMEKLISHLLGCMVYEEGRDTDDRRYTPYPAANSFPDSIRRTPTRFIRKERRIINFTKDFVTEPIDTIRDEHAYYYNGLHAYDVSSSPDGGLIIDGLVSSDYIEGDAVRNRDVTQPFVDFFPYVERTQRDTKYYILPANGEEYLHLVNDINDGDMELLEANPGFIDLVSRDNNHDYRRYRGSKFDNSVNVETFKDSTANTLIRASVGSVHDISLLRGHTFGRDLDGDYESGPGDSLEHVRDPNDNFAPQRVYTNPIGKIRTEQIYDRIKQIYSDDEGPLYTEEVWKETVFTFADTASLIIGMNGSFSIGETQDPSVMNFSPSEELMGSFSSAMNQIQRLYGEAASPINDGVAFATRNNAWLEYGTGDVKLTQTGRILYSRDIDGRAAPFLARPMGIDRQTNYSNTSYWTAPTINTTDVTRSKFYGRDLAVAPIDFSAAREKSKILLHQTPERTEEGLSVEQDNLLPANFYKIPIRVLLTQVFDEGSVTPKEAYCRIVPPEYIRNIHDILTPDRAPNADGLGFAHAVQENTEKLNAALNGIMSEYVAFVDQTHRDVSEDIAQRFADNMPFDEARNLALKIENIREYPGYEEFPDLTTDFIRDHRANEEIYVANPANPDINNQFCSIERIYSRIFENETSSPTFNSDDELDRLFADRGKLLAKSQYRTPQENMDGTGVLFYPSGIDSRVPTVANFTRYEENGKYIKRNHLRSFHFFYEDVDVFSFAGFHKMSFSLGNVIEDYTNSRRSDSLWGHTSRKYTTGNDVQPASAIRDILGGPLGTNSYMRANLTDYNRSPWQQNIPLCLSYSDKFQWGSNIARNGGRHHRRQEYRKLTPYTIWTMNPLPQKRAELYWRVSDNAQWPGGNELDGFRTRVSKTQEEIDRDGILEPSYYYYESPWKQPGFCTIFPGERDVEDIAIPRDDVARDDDYRGVVKYLHILGDQYDPDFITTDRPVGIQIDGPGYNNVNYNKMETFFTKEAGSSLYINDGRISLEDLSLFISSLVSYVTVSNTSLDRGNPLSVFDFTKFASEFNAGRLVQSTIPLTPGDEDRAPYAISDAFILSSIDAQTQEQIRAIPKDLAISAFESVYNVITKLYYKSVYSTSFCVESEYTMQNEHFLSSSYRLYYLHSFMKMVLETSAAYTSAEILYLLAVSGRPNFAKTLQRPTTDEGLYSLEQWIDFIYNNSLRPDASTVERMRSDLDIEDIDSGNISKFLSKLDFYTFSELVLEQQDRNSFLSNYSQRQLGVNLSQGTEEVYYEDVYRNVMSAIHLNSEMLEHQKLSYLRPGQRQESIITRHADQYRAAFTRHSGISENFIRSALLDLSGFDGQTLSGLYRRSEVKQVSRLVANSYLGQDGDGDLTEQQYRNFVNQSGPIQKISEEYRSFLMFLGDEEKSRYLTSPVSSYDETLSEFGSSDFTCINWNTFEFDFNRRKNWMTQELINNNDSKQVFNYIYPIKRYQAVSTAFVTSMLAGYGDMRTVMQSPKRALAFLMAATGMNSSERLQILDSLSQSDLYNFATNNATSNAAEMKCFDFPNLFGEIIEDFWDRLLEMILLFPAILFRGMASAVDPAYKEMKLHWDNCDIDKLKWSAVQWSPEWNKKYKGEVEQLTAGLDKIPDGLKTGRYAPLVSAFGGDLAYSIGKLFDVINGPSTTPMKRTMKHFLGYMYKGPIALVDGAFVFDIPCREDEEPLWETEEAKPWNFGRYGHPLSPLTALALSFQELPGDIRQRELSGCGETPYSKEQIQNAPECPNSNEEPKPFGDMPTPEE